MDTFLIIVQYLLPPGAAAGAVKFFLNGQAKGIQRIEEKVDRVDERVRGVETDVAYLKGQHSRERSEAP